MKLHDFPDDIRPFLLPEIKDNITFWLDAHFPGADAHMKTYESCLNLDVDTNLPLEREIELISKRTSSYTDVLIVDDSLSMRLVIQKTIKASGFNIGEIFHAANGHEALKILEEEWLDLVLSDYNMPEMDGLELIVKMKENEMLRTIPVVMITTEGSQKRVKEFLEKGATDYIKKPFAPEEIRRKLNHIMGETEYGDGSLDGGDEALDF